MLVLSEKDVRRLIDIEELIGALEKAHVQFSTGKAVMPVRQVVPLPEIKGRITTMPAYLSEDRALGMKVVTFFQENPSKSLPAILGTIHLYNVETGKLAAIMDGTYITAIRTACASALATKILANSETPVLGVLGAGVQAAAHIRALDRVREIEIVKVFSPSEKSGQNLKRELESQVKSKIEPVGTAEAAVRGSDLIVAATTAKEPILNSAWLKSGAHINAVGSHRPDLREIDGATMKGAKLFVDSRAAIMAECGDVLLAIQEGAIAASAASVEIGQVLAGEKIGRSNPEEITLYKSVGIAIQDVAAAQLVYRKAVRYDIGAQVDM